MLAKHRDFSCKSENDDDNDTSIMQPAINQHRPGGTNEKRFKDDADKGQFSTIRKYYRVDRREISFLKFILEAYDGIAVLTTVDPLDGVVFFTVAPGCQADVEQLITDLSTDIMIRELDPEAVVPRDDQLL